MAGEIPVAGGGLNSVPAPSKQTLSSAFRRLKINATLGWAQQYLPELNGGKEAEVFGNRTISGFLAQVGAEEAMASDQVIWSEQGRLHIKADSGAVTTPGTGLCTLADHPFRVGDTVVAHDDNRWYWCWSYYQRFMYQKLLLHLHLKFYLTLQIL